MFDFRLKVFDTVARRLNFTKAAEELCITQPAVSKHIREIENHFKIRLFERNGTKIRLTEAGELLLQYTRQLQGVYSNLEFELAALNLQHKGKLRIGASTTIAQYVLSPLLAEFHKRFPEITVTLDINNTEQIEQALQAQTIDVGMIEGQSKNSLFRYSAFLKDEIVLVARSRHPLVKKQQISIHDLLTIPLLLREPGSGTLEVIAYALKPFNIKLSQLRCEMQLGSTESIKSYLLHSDCLAFVSIHSVLDELKSNQLSIIDIEELTIERDFQFIQSLGEADPLVELFGEFTRRYNFK